jgi:hypothetical protein
VSWLKLWSTPAEEDQNEGLLRLGIEPSRPLRTGHLSTQAFMREALDAFYINGGQAGTGLFSIGSANIIIKKDYCHPVYYKKCNQWYRLSHFQRLGTKSARRVKCQGRSNAKRNTLSVDVSVTVYENLIKLYSAAWLIIKTLSLGSNDYSFRNSPEGTLLNFS